jgi:prepilin-type N-terminal cleavage/methylation domain-containing protein
MSAALSCRARPARGFTLIELLVVIGLIALLAGGIGLALGKGDRGTSLRNAQATIASLLSGARAQAALNQANAAIFVNAEPTSDNFLREFRIAVETSPNNWRVTGDPIMLPRGLYLVPAKGAFSSPGQVQFNGTWESGSWSLYPSSSTYDSTDLKLKDSANNNISSEDYNLLVDLSVQGTTSAGKIVVAIAEPQSDGSLRYDSPDLIRGMKVSNYGVASFINEAEAFK